MFDGYWSVISAFIVFFIGFLSVAKLHSVFKLSSYRGMFVYLWHTFFCFAYFLYAQIYGADSLYYYQNAVLGETDFRFGTSAVTVITSLLVHGFGLGILSCFLVFNIFGTIGLLAFDGALKQATEHKPKALKRLASIIIFLPSVSFWSSSIGKDALSFLAMGLAMWAVLQLNKRFSLMVLAVSIMLIVRPHMAGIMVIASAASVMFDKKANIAKRVPLTILAVVGVVVMVPFGLKYAGVSDPSNTDALMNYVETRQSYNMDGGGGVDISNMSLPMKLFTYMFRPIIFEARSITALAASIDNFILLYLFVVGGYSLIKSRSKGLAGSRMFMWVYSGLSWVVLAMTTANLGIAARQKWMFAPMLIFLLISLIGKEKTPVVADTSAANFRRGPRFK